MALASSHFSIKFVANDDLLMRNQGLNNMKKAYFILFCALSGCATHNWVPGVGKQAYMFESEKAQCSLMARHSGGGFYAQGTPGYVAGAQMGHAMGEAVRTQTDFNDCMLAKGWRIADESSSQSKQPPELAATETPSLHSPERPHLKELQEQHEVMVDERIKYIKEKTKAITDARRNNIEELSEQQKIIKARYDQAYIMMLAKNKPLQDYIINVCRPKEDKEYINCALEKKNELIATSIFPDITENMLNLRNESTQQFLRKEITRKEFREISEKLSQDMFKNMTERANTDIKAGIYTGAY